MNAIFSSVFSVFVYGVGREAKYYNGSSLFKEKGIIDVVTLLCKRSAERTFLAHSGRTCTLVESGDSTKKSRKLLVSETIANLRLKGCKENRRWRKITA